MTFFIKKPPSFTWSAFMEFPNLLGLGVGVLFCLRMPFLLFPLVAAEVIYLTLMPQFRWYRKEVVRRHQNALVQGMQQARKKNLQELTHEELFEYNRLADVVEQVTRYNLSRGGVSPLGSEDVVRLHGLLDTYVHMLLTERAWEQRTADEARAELEAELAETRDRQRDARPDSEMAAVLQRSLEVLEARRQALQQMERGADQLQAQRELLKNSFQLLLDRVMASAEAGDEDVEMAALLELVNVTEQVARDGEAIVREVHSAVEDEKAQALEDQPPAV